MQFTPSHLKLWERPSNYMGSEWLEYYVFLGRHRDSDCLENSNYETGLNRLRAIAEPVGWSHDDAPVQSVCETHWAVGWVEWIAIHKDAAEHLQAADEMKARLESYPVLDESDWSEREDEAAQQMWRNCYNEQERVEYIRAHRSQFDFRGFSDMLSCVRGKFFCGYASDLIS